MMEERVLDVQSLSVDFTSFGESVRIINDVSFHINKGETVGIVGESGCGKSMTALAIMQLIQMPPGVLTGNILLNGKNLLGLSQREMQKVRGNDVSMIFQEPMTSLNPVFTVGKQLMEVFTVHQGMSRGQAHQSAIEALKMVNIAIPAQRVAEYPHQLSGGMRQRVMISMALSCKPRLLIADEPTTALDVTIQAQILKLMKELQEQLGTSVMLITHDLGVVSEVCSRAIIMYCGQIIEQAEVEELFKHPLHPYTQGLIKSLPSIGVQEKLYVIPGSVPSPKNFPAGCVFHPRCEHATEKCRQTAPQFCEITYGHSVKCWLYGREE